MTVMSSVAPLPPPLEDDIQVACNDTDVFGVGQALIRKPGESPEEWLKNFYLLGELLHDPIMRDGTRRKVLSLLAVCLWMERANVRDLFVHPEAYPEFILYLALCALALTEEQGVPIRQLLTDRILKKVIRGGQHQQLHVRLGLTRQRDYSFESVGPTGLSNDLESDLYGYFVETVLVFRWPAPRNVLGYLWAVARKRLWTFYHRRAPSRPALYGVPTYSSDEDEADDKALASPALEELVMEARVETEAVEAQVDAERAVACLLPRLSPRERELAALLGDGHSKSEAARRLGLKPATVTTMLRRMRAKVSARG
ncbi:MAG TPA: LuxR C-terminal-related transcriptional regulator [Thermoleophilia bacterium]|nr:LuxR C-terminal-related transcriptional regulator [Thermoleophilia bacterium]